MKKTARTDALRNIKRRFVSWLSMVTIVFIGVSLILGLYFASVALKTTGLKYVDEHGFKDIDISCSIGIQDNEIEKILQIPGVNDAEGVLSFSGQISSFADFARLSPF